jgi:hypothetical protein
MHGYESSATLTTDRLHYKLQTHLLVREGAPRRRTKQFSGKRKRKVKSDHGPQRGVQHQDIPTNRPSVVKWLRLKNCVACVYYSSLYLRMWSLQNTLQRAYVTWVTSKQHCILLHRLISHIKCGYRRQPISPISRREKKKSPHADDMLALLRH